MPLDIKKTILVNELVERQKIAYSRAGRGSPHTGYALVDIGYEELTFCQKRLEELLPRLKEDTFKDKWAFQLPDQVFYALLRD